MMKMNNYLKTFLLGLLLLCGVCHPVNAADAQKFVIGSEFNLGAGEVLQGDLIVVLGDVELYPGSLVDGDVILFGGDLECGGKISGDLTAFGGEVELKDHAEVAGDLTGVGAEIEKKFGAVVGGNSLQGEGFSSGRFKGSSSSREVQTMGMSEPQKIRLTNFIVSLSIVMLLVLISAAVAVIVLALMKKPVRECSALLGKVPWQSFLIGLGGFVIFLCVEVALFITVFLIPLALIFAAAYLFLDAFGLVCVGHSVGKKLNSLLKTSPNEVLYTVLSVFILRLITLLCQVFIPCFGFVPGLVLGFFGTGVAAARLLNFYPQNAEGEIKHYREGIKREIQVHKEDADPLEQPGDKK